MLLYQSPLSPTGKVPVLIADHVPITDSTAILTFLADRHGQLTHPAGSLDRARQDSLTQFLLDEFDSALWVAARHSFILPEALRMPGIKTSLHWEFERSQTTLVQRMGEGDFDERIEVSGPQDLQHLGRQLDWMRLRLIELREEKQRFLHHMSHELKTPLAAMRDVAIDHADVSRTRKVLGGGSVVLAAILQP